MYNSMQVACSVFDMDAYSAVRKDRNDSDLSEEYTPMVCGGEGDNTCVDVTELTLKPLRGENTKSVCLSVSHNK